MAFAITAAGSKYMIFTATTDHFTFNRVNIMYELMDGIISIVGGVYCYLTAIGKITVNKNEEQSIVWRRKYGKVLKLMAVAMFFFGIFKVYQYLTVL